MEYIKVMLAALLSLAVIFLITKLQGNKQLSQLKLFDYINGITVGSIAAELATELERPLYPLIALAVYGSIGFAVTMIELKSMKFRRVVSGTPTVLFQSGKMVRENFKRAGLDVNDFMSRCRVLGFFDLSEVELAILEPSGQLSILPKESARPTVLGDLHEPDKTATASIGVIYDGHVIEKNLRAAGYERDWLERQVHRQGYQIGDVFLATCDVQGNLRAFGEKKDKTNSFFTV